MGSFGKTSFPTTKKTHAFVPFNLVAVNLEKNGKYNCRAGI
jgi:hypothetical protein